MTRLLRNCKKGQNEKTNLFLLLAFLFLAGTGTAQNDLIITGVVDGDLSGGLPKAVELYAVNDIANLNVYAFGSANNGGGTDGAELPLSGSLTAGDYFYIATEDVQFTSYFGFAPDMTDGSAPNVNGDDALELFYDASATFSGSETVVDTYGVATTNGDGEPWDYTDGWAYRKDGTSSDAFFQVNSWEYSGLGGLDGETSNTSASNPAPLGTYAHAGVPMQTTTMEFQITADQDAIEEDLTDGSIDAASSDLELGYDANIQRVGLRFVDLLIPAGATVNSAYIQFTVDEDVNEDPCVQTISVEDVGNSSAFGTSTGELTNRTESSTATTWDISGTWFTGDAGSDQQTADISSLIQGIVSKNDYAIGNALSIFFEGTGKRIVETAGSTGPKLVVNVTAPEADFLSVGNDILSFTFASADNAGLTEDIVGLIVEDEIYVSVPQGTDVSSLVPTIDISADATIDPAATAQDFNGIISYTVTSETNKTQSYDVRVLEEAYANDFSSDPFANGWTQYDAAGTAHSWAWSSSNERIFINPYSTDNCVADDWLFSPVMDLDAWKNEVLIITVDENFSGTDLELIFSNEYVSGTDPRTYDFEEATTIESGEEGTYAFPLEGLNGQGTFIVKYNDDASCGEWRVNDFTLLGKTPQPLTLQLLHYADVDGNEETALDAVDEFSAVVENFKSDPQLSDNTLLVSSGDIIIPGPRFYAAEQAAVQAITGSNEPGHVDVAIANAIGVRASAVGNHELDANPEEFQDAAMQSGEVSSDFPWLAANIDFSEQVALDEKIGEDGETVEKLAGSVARYAVVEVDGQLIGLVGASTPQLPTITSTDDLIITPGLDDPIEDLAEVIQESVDELLEQGIDKIILLAHMQQIAIEKQLAILLEGVDVIVAGGSNTRMGNSSNTLFTGDDAFAEAYPFTATSASSEPVLVVNVDGDYKYLGRLVVDFDAHGVIDLTSIDDTQSGAFASIAANAGTASANATVVAIRDAVQSVIVAQYGNIVGYTDVYLDGRRGSVRTQETNLGNLSADANLWYANQLSSETVDVSLKNGGGIRTEIGSAILPPGEVDNSKTVFSPPTGGGVSEGHLRATFRFDNDLVRVTVTANELVTLLEHGFAATVAGATPGQFPQISGMELEYDVFAPAGSRIHKLTVTGEDGTGTDVVVQDGNIQGDGSRTFNLVTLNFLADGGDAYPFNMVSAPNRVDFDDSPFASLDPGNQSAFSNTGGEQDALAEYLLAFHATTGAAFANAETSIEEDARIKQVGSFEYLNTNPTITAAFLGRYTNDSEEAAEIAAFDAETARLYVIDSEAGTIDVVDISDPTTPSKLGTTVNFTAPANFVAGGFTSIATNGSTLAVSVPSDDQTANGKVALFDMEGTQLATYDTGVLPDMVTFTPDGNTVLVANEGTADDFLTVNPEGSVTIVDITSGETTGIVSTADFTSFNSQRATLEAAGLIISSPAADSPGDRTEIVISEDPTLSQDMEPEYIVVSEDGTKAFVALQENNAIAVLDLATKAFTDIHPLGFKDHSVYGLDASNRDDAIKIATYDNLYGIYMPDAIAGFTANSTNYIVTANEGDSRIFPGGDIDNGPDEGDFFEGEERIKDLDLDATAFPNAEWLQEDENLGRLKVLPSLGLNGNDEYEELYAFGGRSFSIFDESGNLVFDSGEDFERITAQVRPELFNSEDSDPDEFDGRSDDKGVEAEGVVVGEIEGRTYAFIGLERRNGFMIYDITDPANATFESFVDAGQEDISPEGMIFVPANQSPLRAPLVITSNEGSGTVAIYQVGDAKTIGVSLSSDVTTGTEASATVITLTATADSEVGLDESVDITISGTGIESTDYTLSDQSITIDAGKMVGTASITVIDDADYEPTAEELSATISNPSAGLELLTNVSVTITITDNDAPLSAEGLSELRVFPVPTSSTLNIVHESRIFTRVNVLNIEGKKVLTERIKDGQLNISGLAKGLYILELIDASSNEHFRVKILKD